MLLYERNINSTCEAWLKNETSLEALRTVIGYYELELIKKNIYINTMWYWKGNLIDIKLSSYSFDKYNDIYSTSYHQNLSQK